MESTTTGGTTNIWRISSVSLLILLVVSQYNSCHNSDKVKELQTLNEASQDTITHTRNVLGQETAKTSLLVVEHADDLLKLKSKDSTILRLQEAIRDYKGKLLSATVGSTTTDDNGHTGTTVTKGEVVVHHGKSTKDTCSCDSVFVYPKYSTTWKEKWSEGSIRATKDSIYRNIQVINEFTIIQGFDKPHWWSESKPKVTFKNENPNTTITELKSIIVDTKPKRIGIGIGATYGIDMLTLKPALTIGVTGSYNFIRF